MRRQEYLEHLDRAFTKTPPELNASVEEAFRRGEEAMKQRHKIMTALSVAAAVAVLCAALALAAGRMIAPKPDTVAARGSATSKPGRALLSDRQAPTSELPPGSTPELTPEPTPQPVATDALELVYTQPNSNYYHVVPDCSGMVDAVAWTLESAVSVGKQPCPICMGGEMESEEAAPESEESPAAMGRFTPVPTAEPEEYGMVGGEVYDDSRMDVYYATIEGAYYHEDPHCSGMKGALPWTFEALWYKNEQAVRTGNVGYKVKRPCPVCTEWDLPVVNVYATAKGKYYHIDKNCSGMRNATRYYTSESAEEAGKTHCPVCLPDDDNLCCATLEGQYYHRELECMGMRNARICLETSAQRQGKTPCPVCWK